MIVRGVTPTIRASRFAFTFSAIYTPRPRKEGTEDFSDRLKKPGASGDTRPERKEKDPLRPPALSDPARRRVPFAPGLPVASGEGIGVPGTSPPPR
ncbi:MAG: hypothetical protein Kow00128_10550 [Deltaproteobacteria bacterium]